MLVQALHLIDDVTFLSLVLSQMTLHFEVEFYFQIKLKS